MNPGAISGPAGLLSAWLQSKYLDFTVVSDIKFYPHMRKTALFSLVFFRVPLMLPCLKISLSSFSSIVGNGRSQSPFWSWTMHLFTILIESTKYALTQESN
jgi:hypothetical protein